jgi:hypothetical protein
MLLTAGGASEEGRGRSGGKGGTATSGERRGVGSGGGEDGRRWPAVATREDLGGGGVLRERMSVGGGRREGEGLGFADGVGVKYS